MKPLDALQQSFDCVHARMRRHDAHPAASPERRSNRCRGRAALELSRVAVLRSEQLLAAQPGLTGVLISQPPHHR